MLRAALLTTALVAPSQLFAQATTERAEAIAAELQRFLPQSSAALTVTPSGADYVVALDLNALASEQAQEGLSVEASPFTMRLTEAEGGTYAVNYDQPLTAKVTYKDEFDASISIARMVGTGQFDPALGAFTTHELTYTDLSYSQASGPNGEMGKVDYKFDTIETKSAAKANPAGGIDVEASYSGSGLVEDIVMPNPSGGAAWNISLGAAQSEGEIAIIGSRSLPLLELVAFAFENFPTEGESPELQTEAKEKIRAAAPFFDSASMEGRLHELTLATPVGAFGAESATVALEANGAVEEGRFYEQFTLSGVTIPAGLLPDWAAPLIPADGTIGFDVTDFNLATPLGIFLDQVDFNTGPDSETEANLASALLPDGKVNIVVTLGAEAEGTYALDALGDIKVGSMPLPTGKARVSLTGIDAILAHINNAPAEIKQGAIPGIGMVRGLGKVEGDATVWDIEMPETGGVFVNGNDVSMFLQ